MFLDFQNLSTCSLYLQRFEYLFFISRSLQHNTECFTGLFLSQSAIMSFGLPRLSINYLKHVFNPIMIFAYGFLHTFRVGSVYVTLAVTFERFHAIICPLRHFKRKKYMLPACTIFAIVYNLPKYFELQIKVSMSWLKCQKKRKKN